MITFLCYLILFWFLSESLDNHKLRFSFENQYLSLLFPYTEFLLIRKIYVYIYCVKTLMLHGLCIFIAISLKTYSYHTWRLHFSRKRFRQTDIMFPTFILTTPFEVLQTFIHLLRAFLRKTRAYCITLSWIQPRDGFLRVDLARGTGENTAAKCTSSNGARARERSLSALKCTWKFVSLRGENKSVHTSANRKTLWSDDERDYASCIHYTHHTYVSNAKTRYTSENSLKTFEFYFG